MTSRPPQKGTTLYLAEKVQAQRLRAHQSQCHTCGQDPAFRQMFKTVGEHVEALRAQTAGWTPAEAADFMSTHLHAALLRAVVGLEEKCNAVAQAVAQVEAVLTLDQDGELEKLRQFTRALQ